MDWIKKLRDYALDKPAVQIQSVASADSISPQRRFRNNTSSFTEASGGGFHQTMLNFRQRLARITERASGVRRIRVTSCGVDKGHREISLYSQEPNQFLMLHAIL